MVNFKGSRLLLMALVLECSFAAVAVWCAVNADAASAPRPAVQAAVSRARAQFNTQDVHADFSLVSRRDPRWILIDGRATKKDRLWAAWLHDDGRGRWSIRYFDTTAPFQPQSSTHGRVPCDLYPAFSEPLCY